MGGATMKPKVLKFSEHCDKQKHDHAFCVDERMTELAFAVSVLLETVMGQRGCSRNVARMYAATLLKGEAVSVLLEAKQMVGGTMIYFDYQNQAWVVNGELDLAVPRAAIDKADGRRG